MTNTRLDLNNYVSKIFRKMINFYIEKFSRRDSSPKNVDLPKYIISEKCRFTEIHDLLKLTFSSDLSRASWISSPHTSKFFVGALAIFSGVKSTISWKATQIMSGSFWRESSGATKTDGKSPLRPSDVSPVHQSPFSEFSKLVWKFLKSNKRSLTFIINVQLPLFT